MRRLAAALAALGLLLAVAAPAAAVTPPAPRCATRTIPRVVVPCPVPPVHPR
jgi:hypothetical protein